MLSVIDPEAACGPAGIYAALFAAMLVPTLSRRSRGRVVLRVALVLGLALFVLARTVRDRAQRASARALFFGSITYLPLLWIGDDSRETVTRV